MLGSNPRGYPPCFVTALLLSVSLLPVSAAAQARCNVTGAAVQVLGSGGPLAGTDRASSSYLVWVDGEARVMVDVGGGAFLRFGQAGAALETLDLLALSHFHPDHVSDLPALLWLSDIPRQEPLAISGPSGNDVFPSLEELLTRLFDPERGAFQVLGGTLGADQERFRSAGRGVLLRPTTIDVSSPAPVSILTTPDVEVTALPVPHTNSPSVAYRVVTRGLSIVFSGDQTGRDPRFVDFARGADVLVMHLALSPDASGGILDVHATPTRVGEVARDARVGRLVVSHFFPGEGRSLSDLEGSVTEVRRFYDGPVSVSRDLDCFGLGQEPER